VVVEDAGQEQPKHVLRHVGDEQVQGGVAEVRDILHIPPHVVVLVREDRCQTVA